MQTTGDNYTQTPKPKLREKLAKLFSKIVYHYDIPSNSQMKNLKVLKADLQQAHQSFERINQKYFKRFEKKAVKLGLEAFQIKTFEEFVKK